MSDIPMKRCTGLCGQEYPATKEYWSQNGRGAWRGQCKICCNQKTRDYRRRPDVQERDKDYRRRPDVQERLKEWNSNYHSRPEIQEHYKARWKEYSSRPEIQEHLRDHRKEYYNRPGVHERIKTYNKTRNIRPEIQEHLRDHRKEYYNRPGVHERYRIYCHTRRSRKRSVIGNHTPEQIQDQLNRQRRKCYYCHARFKKAKGKYQYHIEHTFPLSRVAGTDIPANSIDYLVLSCPSCNLSKGDKFPWEFPEGGRLI